MNKRKKVLLIWTVLLAVLAAAALFFSVLLPKILNSSKNSASNVEYIDPYNYFYDPVWAPLSTRDDYEDFLDLNRFIYFKEGNVTRGISEDNEQSFTDDALFFKKYFDAIEAGDADAYNALFTADYKAEFGEKEPFTPQMTYDRLIERVSITHSGAVSSYTYNVYYKFFHNDGTFRDDVYSDAERPLQIIIDTSERELKISSLKYFT
jgi:hypothetical protein